MKHDFIIAIEEYEWTGSPMAKATKKATAQMVVVVREFVHAKGIGMINVTPNELCKAVDQEP